MADQTVAISNLPDSGSRHAVALELAKIILHNTAGAAQDRKTVYTEENILRVFKACGAATNF